MQESSLYPTKFGDMKRVAKDLTGQFVSLTRILSIIPEFTWRESLLSLSKILLQMRHMTSNRNKDRRTPENIYLIMEELSRRYKNNDKKVF